MKTGSAIFWLIVDSLIEAIWMLDEQTTAILSPQTSVQSSEVILQVVLLEAAPDSLRAKLVRVQ